MTATPLSSIVDASLAWSLPGPGVKAFGPAFNRPLLRRTWFFVPPPVKQIPVYVLAVPALSAEQLPDGESLTFAMLNLNNPPDDVAQIIPRAGGNFGIVTGSNGAGAAATALALYWPGAALSTLNGTGDFDAPLAITSRGANTADIACMVACYRSPLPVRLPMTGPPGLDPMVGVGIGVAVDVNS